MTARRTLLLLTLIAVLLVTPVLAGCGTTPTPTAVPTQAPTTAATKPPSPTAVPPTSVPPTAVPPTAAPTKVPPTATAKAPVVGGKMVWALTGDMDTFDPGKTNSQGFLKSHLGVTLATLDPDKPNSYVPYLAEKWEISPDGLTWTFTIKKGVKFTDGTPCNAQAIEYTWSRILNPDFKAGAGKSVLASVKSFKALDDTTFQVVLPSVDASFLANTNSGYLSPVSKQAVEQLGDQFGSKPVLSGPYYVKEWQKGAKFVFERNPDFNWAPSFVKGGPFIQTIEFQIIPETATILAGLEAGQVDYADIADYLQVQRIKNTDKFGFFEGLLKGATPYVAINNEVAPFTDIRVRKALNLAVDRDTLVKVVMQGEGVPQYGPLSASCIGYWPGVEQIGYHFNLDQAKALMKEAGYTAGADGVLQKDGKPLKITLRAFSAPDTFVKTSEVLQQQWKALGVAIEISTGDRATIFSEVLTGKTQLAVIGYDWPNDPSQILRLVFHSAQLKGGGQLTRINDPTFDALWDKTISITDQVKRQEAINDVQKYVVEQAYQIPLFTPKVYTAISKRIQGWKVSAVGNWLNMWDAYIAP